VRNLLSAEVLGTMAHTGFACETATGLKKIGVIAGREREGNFIG
jgi:hypothetical protein